MRTLLFFAFTSCNHLKGGVKTLEALDDGGRLSVFLVIVVIMFTDMSQGTVSFIPFDFLFRNDKVWLLSHHCIATSDAVDPVTAEVGIDFQHMGSEELVKVVHDVIVSPPKSVQSILAVAQHVSEGTGGEGAEGHLQL